MLIHGFQWGQTIAIPIYTVLPYCVMIIFMCIVSLRAPCTYDAHQSMISTHLCRDIVAWCLAMQEVYRSYDRVMPDLTTNILHLVQNVSCKVYVTVVYIHCSKYQCSIYQHRQYYTVASYVSISAELLESVLSHRQGNRSRGIYSISHNLHTSTHSQHDLLLTIEQTFSWHSILF